MNQLFKKTLCLFACIFNLNIHSTDSVITMFIQKYPYLSKSEIKKIKRTPDEVHAVKYSKALKQPDFLYKNSINSYKNKQKLPNVMCIYAGNVAISTPDGQISFPRLQQKSEMYILVTDKIIPAYMIAPATIANWMIDPKVPTEMYLMKLENDATTHLSYWQTSKVDLPKDNNIPLNTLIFIADPSTMYIPLGATVSDRSPNIVLPTIYIKKGFCFIKNSLFTLAINQYFRNTKTSIKQDDQTVALIQQPN